MSCHTCYTCPHAQLSDVSHIAKSDARHDTFTCVTWLIQTGAFTCVTWFIQMCGVTHEGVANSAMFQKCRRPIGCLKLQVIFLKRGLWFVALLREMTFNWRHPMGLRLDMWRVHVTRVNESWHTCAWVMSHMWHMLPHVWCRIASQNGWVMSHMRRSHVTCVNVSRHTYDFICDIRTHMYMLAWRCVAVPNEWVMLHMRISHVTCVNVSRHTYDFMWMGRVTHMS